jgi:hypothetical protein
MENPEACSLNVGAHGGRSRLTTLVTTLVRNVWIGAMEQIVERCMWTLREVPGLDVRG